MKKLLLCMSALAALGGCATTADNATTVAAVTDTEYPTGSNIPRKKGSANTATMSVQDAEEMRRSAEAQRTNKNGI